MAQLTTRVLDIQRLIRYAAIFAAPALHTSLSYTLAITDLSVRRVWRIITYSSPTSSMNVNDEDMRDT